MSIAEMAKKVKTASIQLSAASAEDRNEALKRIAAVLEENQLAIEQANLIDLNRSREENIPEPLLKRLKYDRGKIKETIDGIHSLIGLEDPIGKTLLSTELDEGLELYRVSCPIGVIGIIFESRPDALVQISTLCLKSGNGVLLKGGREAKETNRILAELIKKATGGELIPEDWLFLLETREEVNEMLSLDQYLDLIIPRGSNEFVKYIMDHSRIPVMGHADGICHCYMDQFGDVEMGVKVALDSKAQYVAVCNATETLLVHQAISEQFLPMIKEAFDIAHVRMVGCERTQKIIPVPLATETDWRTEYLDYAISIKIVDSLEAAIEHINEYGSGHTDCIITKDRDRAESFMNLVDSGNVFWNCSTRFSDGFKYGFGAEVGISTSKLHARGPVGLEGLVSYKYKLLGSGNIVADYASKSKTFTHRKLDSSFCDALNSKGIE